MQFFSKKTLTKSLLVALALTLALPALADDEEVIERTITARDGRFIPEVVEVPAGKKIRLIFVNEGPGPEEFESTVLGFEKVMNEGVTRKVVIQPLKPGEYAFFGEFHMDTANGKIVAR